MEVILDQRIKHFYNTHLVLAMIIKEIFTLQIEVITEYVKLISGELLPLLLEMVPIHLAETMVQQINQAWHFQQM